MGNGSVPEVSKTEVIGQDSPNVWIAPERRATRTFLAR